MEGKKGKGERERKGKVAVLSERRIAEYIKEIL